LCIAVRRLKLKTKWLTLGRWLAAALEFELAADILRTAITPTWNDIEQLAAIAALRTALNYFLAKEIEKESSAGQRRAERITLGAKEGRLESPLPAMGDREHNNFELPIRPTRVRSTDA
jgi:Protein of unknown function (DUF1622)